MKRGLRGDAVRANFCHGRARRKCGWTSRPQSHAKVGDVDIEALSRNLSRALIEEGGKALAAYLKPREEGKIKDDTAEDHHRRRQSHRPSGRISGCPIPRRALELQTTLGRAYLDLWAGRRQTHGRRADRTGRSPPIPETSASPTRNGRRTSSSISSSRLICSATQWAERLVRDAAGR